MASEGHIFSLYKVQQEEKYYLLRTERRSFSNVFQREEDDEVQKEQHNRALMLDCIGTALDLNEKAVFDFIGELQGYPIGERLYEERGNIELEIYYLETQFGHPWIILGNADSEEAFLAALNADEDLVRLNPVGQPKRIIATFLTERDFGNRI